MRKSNSGRIALPPSVAVLVVLASGAGACAGSQLHRTPATAPSEPSRSSQTPDVVPASTTNEASAGASATRSEAAASVPAKQRVVAWKAQLPAGWSVIGEGTAGGFFYAAAANGADPPTEAKAILATDHGETEAPMGGGVGVPLHAGELTDVGDLDGDGKRDVVVHTGGLELGGLAVFLDAPGGPKEAWSVPGPTECFRATHNGKPALHISPIDTSGESEGAWFHVFWNGKEFEQVAAPPPSTPEASAAC